MNISENAKNLIELPTFEGAVPCELSADYILPDIYPDVKKILRVSAHPVLIGRFVSGRRLEFSGAVDYSVVFSCEVDGADAVRSVHFSGEWGGALGELEELDSSDIMIAPRISACKAKLANPRKLTIRSTVVCDVNITTPVSCDPECEGARTTEEELALERRTEVFESGCRRTFTSEPLRLSENIDIDASAPAIDEVISCDVFLHFHEAKPSSDSDMTVSLKGTASVECIYKPIGEVGEYRSLKRKLPVTYLISADDIAEGLKGCRADTLCARAVGTPIEVNTAVREDSYGERRVLELDMSADITVRLMGSRDAVLTLDAYSVDRDSECEFTELECLSPRQVISANFSVGESTAREELKLPEGASVVDAQVCVESPKLDIARSRGTLTASAQISCIFSDGAGGFISAEAVLPLKYELSVGDIREPIVFDCVMTPSDLRTRLDSERMYFDFEVSICGELGERSRRRTVSRIKLSGEPKSSVSDSSVTVCYRSREETLWDIAKRYATTTRAIEAVNKDTSRVIMIPQGMPKSFVI